MTDTHVSEQEIAVEHRTSLPARQLTAGEVMSSAAHWVNERASVLAAAALMQTAQVHHLPVLRHDSVVGVVDEASLRSLLRRSADSDLAAPSARVSVGEVMSRAVCRCAPSTPLSQLAHLLLASPTGAVVIVDDGRLAGIITARDLVAAHFTTHGE